MINKYGFCESINLEFVRKRKGNQEFTIKRNWQHWIHRTKTNKTKHTTQYVLEATICKQIQIM